MYRPLVSEVRRSTITRQDLLAEELHCDTSTVNRMVRSLERAGVLYRHPALGEGTPVGMATTRPIELGRDIGVLVALDVHDLGYATATVTNTHYLPLKDSEGDIHTTVDIRGHPAPFEAAQNDPIHWMAEVVVRALDEANQHGGLRLIGVGVGLAGPIYRPGRRASPSITPWIPGDVNIRDELTRALRYLGVTPPRGEAGLREWVIVENDASAGALGVLVHALLEGNTFDTPMDLVYVHIGEGIGAGIVNKGHAVMGSSGVAGELGHLRVKPDGLLCPRCGGRGCLETAASEKAIREQLHGILDWKPDKEPEAKHGPAVDEALWEGGWCLGVGLAHVCALLNPALIVLDGDTARHHRYRQAMSHALERNVIPEVLAETGLSGEPLRVEHWEERPAPRNRTPGLNALTIGLLGRVLDSLGDGYLLDPVRVWVRRGWHRTGAPVDWNLAADD